MNVSVTLSPAARLPMVEYPYSCLDCLSSVDGARGLECRRLAPKLDRATGRGVWPRVEPDDRCDRHQCAHVFG
jgi:hypothetical protein